MQLVIFDCLVRVWLAADYVTAFVAVVAIV